jgi:hypothetical protein
MKEIDAFSRMLDDIGNEARRSAVYEVGTLKLRAYLDDKHTYTVIRTLEAFEEAGFEDLRELPALTEDEIQDIFDAYNQRRLN